MAESGLGFLFNRENPYTKKAKMMAEMMNTRDDPYGYNALANIPLKALMGYSMRKGNEWDEEQKEAGLRYLMKGQEREQAKEQRDVMDWELGQQKKEQDIKFGVTDEMRKEDEARRKKAEFELSSEKLRKEIGNIDTNQGLDADKKRVETTKIIIGTIGENIKLAKPNDPKDPFIDIANQIANSPDYKKYLGFEKESPVIIVKRDEKNVQVYGKHMYNIGSDGNTTIRSKEGKWVPATEENKKNAMEIELPNKPEDEGKESRTTDMKELDVINAERGKKGLPSLSLEEYKKMKFKWNDPYGVRGDIRGRFDKSQEKERPPLSSFEGQKK